MEDTRPEPLWQTLDKHTIHRGRVVLVDHTVRLPDGSTTHYEVDESIPFAVAALVIDGDDILLARQYRHPVGRWIYDLPAGAAEDGELPTPQSGERSKRSSVSSPPTSGRSTRSG